MIGDLLSFAQAAGSETHTSEEISLEHALARAMEPHAAAIARTGATITHDPLPQVIGDASQFAQLFQNLIENSLKYRQPDVPPRIHVSAAREADEWVVTVRDNGIGFKPEYAGRIFGVFQRLHHGELAGTGIGLTICKGIVERRGGRIWADGKPGEGALFSFTIPDSLEVIRPAAPLPWERVQAIYTGRGLSPGDGNVPFGAFDELLHTLDLTKCVVRDMTGRILIWTKGAERLFGFTQREALGQRAQDLLHKEFPEPLEEVEAELLSNGEWAGPLKAQKKDGSVVWLSTCLSLHRNGRGHPQSVIEIHSDVSELRRW
jgi:PAS domain S-box-containing protein